MHFTARSDQNTPELEKTLRHVVDTHYAKRDEQRVDKSAGLGVDQRPVGQVFNILFQPLE